MLNQHPRIQAGLGGKELHYFNRKIFLGKSIGWYESRFKGAEHLLYFESTPEYLSTPGCAQRIHDAYGADIKIIIILRNPVHRAFSAYNHYRTSFYKSGVHRKRARRHAEDLAKNLTGNLLYEQYFKGRVEFPTFDECIEIEIANSTQNYIFEPSILRGGLYFDQVSSYIDLFGSNVLILGFNQFIKHTTQTLSDVLDFLGVSPCEFNSFKIEIRNAKKYTAQISPKQLAFLNEFYQNHNSKFINQFGNIDW